MLRDHFHPPLSETRHWYSFFRAWAVTIATHLNEQLPKEWFAEPHALIKNDEEKEYVIHVREDKKLERGGIAAKILLITPGDKAKEESRKKLITRYEGWLVRDVGLMFVDIVTSFPTSLHAEFLPILQPQAVIPKDPLYAASYHHMGEDIFEPYSEVWHQSLTLGESLPVMPLYLNRGPMMPLDLSETYQRALKAVWIEPSNEN